MTSRWGIASSSISIASAAGLSRRKHMMSRQLTPSSVSPSRSARVMPPTTSANGTPLRHVALGIEEHLHVPGAVRRDAAHVGRRQVVEVLLGDQDRDSVEVDVQEVLEVAEAVLGAALLRRRARQLDAVAAAELQQQFGLERALDVQVQLRLGQATDELGERRVRLLVAGAGVVASDTHPPCGPWIDAVVPAGRGSGNGRGWLPGLGRGHDTQVERRRAGRPHQAQPEGQPHLLRRAPP